mgnify:CR=1 FL=1
MVNRYRNIRQEKTQTGISYVTNPVYPEIAPSANDYYIVASAGDRYDTLAQHFYNDFSLWWIIASANTAGVSSLAIEPGLQVRIPANPLNIVAEFEKLNKIR